MDRILALLAGSWLGMHLTVGYVAAPVLFRHLDKMTAGNLAGRLFEAGNYYGLAVWAAVWLCLVRRVSYSRRKPVYPKFVLLLVLLLAANQFLVTPVINALKTGGSDWLLDLAGGGFGVWHGISSVIYLAAAVCGIGLVWSRCRFDMPRD